MIVQNNKPTLIKISDDATVNVDDIVAIYRKPNAITEILFRGIETALNVADKDGKIMDKIIAASKKITFQTVC